MFYVQLVKLCEERNEKLSPLLKKLGLGTGNIERWRNGTSPTGNTILKFAEYFNVSADYLLGNSEIENPELLIPDELKGARIAFNRGEFDDLTQEEVDALANIARTFKNQRKGD